MSIYTTRSIKATETTSAIQFARTSLSEPFDESPAVSLEPVLAASAALVVSLLLSDSAGCWTTTGNSPEASCPVSCGDATVLIDCMAPLGFATTNPPVA
jgi:hypothetical protein